MDLRFPLLFTDVETVSLSSYIKSKGKGLKKKAASSQHKVVIHSMVFVVGLN